MKVDLTKLVVRPITEADKEAILDIDKAVSGLDRSAYLEAKLYRALADGRMNASLVAEYEGRVIGFIMGEVYLGEFGIPEDTATIDTIGVHPAYQRSGVAHFLLDEYKSHLKAAGVKRLHTLVEWNDWQLIHFFDSVGFSPSRALSLVLELD
jgi:ribosomal protein S18 acetylase RimI-like enzyme